MHDLRVCAWPLEPATSKPRWQCARAHARAPMNSRAAPQVRAHTRAARARPMLARSGTERHERALQSPHAAPAACERGWRSWCQKARARRPWAMRTPTQPGWTVAAVRVGSACASRQLTRARRPSTCARGRSAGTHQRVYEQADGLGCLRPRHWSLDPGALRLHPAAVASRPLPASVVSRTFSRR